MTINIDNNSNNDNNEYILILHEKSIWTIIWEISTEIFSSLFSKRYYLLDILKL